MEPASAAIAFATPADLRQWFDRHSRSTPELWVHIHKVSTAIPSVTWEDCVVASLAYGWIDGIKKSLGPDAYIQRLSPRKKQSAWSKRNRDHAERLIAAGLMTADGQAQVTAAKLDGRWDAAYAGPSEMQIPDDFMAALALAPRARQTFDSLNKQNLYAIYYRLHSTRAPEARARRLAAMIATLDRGARFHD